MVVGGIYMGLLSRRKKKHITKKKKGVIKRSVDVASWMHTEHLGQEHRFIKTLCASVFSLKKKSSSASESSFNQLREKHAYSDAKLQQLQRQSLRLSYGYAGFAAVVALYVIHLLSLGLLMAGITSFCLVLALLAFAFKESYFAFCLKRQSFELGFKDWCQYMIKREVK